MLYKHHHWVQQNPWPRCLAADRCVYLALENTSHCSSGCPFALPWQQKDTLIRGGNGVGIARALLGLNSPAMVAVFRNSALQFYSSHVSHTTCLIIDEIVRSWGHRLPPCVPALMEEVLKESQRCYCNKNYIYLIINPASMSTLFFCPFFVGNN